MSTEKRSAKERNRLISAANFKIIFLFNAQFPETLVSQSSRNKTNIKRGEDGYKFLTHVSAA
jgi:hypothetical protein